MTRPRQDRIAGLLRKRISNNQGKEPSRIEDLNLLLQASSLADQDFKECHTNEQKQKVWHALIGVVYAVVKSKDTSEDPAGTALKALVVALRNTSLGNPGNHGLEATRISSRKPFSEDWCRAATFALLQRYPDRRDEILKESEKALSLSKKQVTKLFYNYRHSGLGGLVMERLVKTAIILIDETGANSLNQLVQSDC